jgi:hypothetical protein
MSRIRYNIARRSRLPILLAVACVTAASCAVYVPSQECVSDADCSEGFRCGNESSCVALTAEAPVVCVAADGCVSPRVSVMLGQVEATRFSVMLNVDEPGSLPIVSMEACTSLNDAPSPDDATTQCLPAVDGANWQRQVTFDGREPDAVHFVFARVSTAAESVSSAVVQANTPPLAPANVRASDGSLVEAVEVVWDEVEGAREYLVWRDNSLVAVVDRAAYTDRDALPGGAPLAPVVDATDGTESFYVDVRWTPPASVPGATHRYSVQTAGQTGTSAMSQADDGFRAGEPATRYDLKIDDGEWFEVSGENYYHFEAPRRRFVTVPMTTTRGTIYGQIRASMPELPLYDPVLTGYSVRASNSAGSGPAGIDAGYLGSARADTLRSRSAITGTTGSILGGLTRSNR